MVLFENSTNVINRQELGERDLLGLVGLADGHAVEAG